MGLDVYLYEYDDAAAVLAAEDDADAFSTAAWSAAGSYEAMSQSQKDAVTASCAAHNIALGLDEWGSDKTRKRRVEINSAKYPEHMFKIGYFRSSYNSGGINSIARDLIDMDLYSVFSPGDNYILTPDWKMVREIALEFHRKLNDAPRLRVATISANLFGPKPTVTAQEAISLTLTERARPNPFGDSSYSKGDGTFFSKPFPIIAAISGVSGLKESAVHLVYEDEGFDWYVQSAEIVIETIDYVLAQPDIAKYRLHWSS